MKVYDKIDYSSLANLYELDSHVVGPDQEGSKRRYRLRFVPSNLLISLKVQQSTTMLHVIYYATTVVLAYLVQNNTLE